RLVGRALGRRRGGVRLALLGPSFAGVARRAGSRLGGRRPALLAQRRDHAGDRPSVARGGDAAAAHGWLRHPLAVDSSSISYVAFVVACRVIATPLRHYVSREHYALTSALTSAFTSCRKYVSHRCR